MKILSVHLNNTKSHHDSLFTFSSGINVLCGANGAGKSTVFEAIGYALFGVDAQEFVANVTRFVTIGAKSGKISVVFQSDDGDIWKVTRTVCTPSKWLLAKKTGEDFEVEEHARAEETAVRIAGLLGLGKGRPLSEQFTLVIGPFQNEFLGPFIIRQAARRQEAFDEILGIDTWRKTFKGTSTLLAAVQTRIKLIRVEVEGLEQQLTILPGKKDECLAVRKVLSEQQLELTRKELLFDALQVRIDELDRKKSFIDALSTELEKIETRIKNSGEIIASQKLMVEAAEKANTIVQASWEGKVAFDAAEATLGELREKEKKRRILEQDIAGLEKTAQRLSLQLDHEKADIIKVQQELLDEEAGHGITRIELVEKCRPEINTTSLEELRLESERIKQERSGLAGRLEALVEGQDKLAEGTCPFFLEQCQNIVGTTPQDHFTIKRDDLEGLITELDKGIVQAEGNVKVAEQSAKELDGNIIRLQELDKQLIAIAERLQTNSKRNETLEKLHIELSEAIALVNNRKAGLKAYASLDADIQKAETDKKSFLGARDAYAENLLVADDLENRRLTLVRYEKAVDCFVNELAVIKSNRTECMENYQLELHEDARKERDNALSELAAMRQKNVDMDNTIKRLEKEILELERIAVTVAEKLEVIVGLEKQERLVKFLRNQVFKNVSAALSERFREEISLRSDRIYRSIAESDEELRWGDNYQIILRDMDEGCIRERSDDQLSGGQTMSAVVALRLALLQTIGARIAFFDEPTSNLDASRRENLANAFRAIEIGREEVTEHWYDQLFLISHDVSFTEITDQMILIGE